jgi:hypothetical protein
MLRRPTIEHHALYGVLLNNLVFAVKEAEGSSLYNDFRELLNRISTANDGYIIDIPKTIQQLVDGRHLDEKDSYVIYSLGLLLPFYDYERYQFAKDVTKSTIVNLMKDTIHYISPLLALVESSVNFMLIDQTYVTATKIVKYVQSILLYASYGSFVLQRKDIDDAELGLMSLFAIKLRLLTSPMQRHRM